MFTKQYHSLMDTGTLMSPSHDYGRHNKQKEGKALGAVCANNQLTLIRSHTKQCNLVFTVWRAIVFMYSLYSSPIQVMVMFVCSSFESFCTEL
jgi:hypothetical protein